MSLTSTGVFIDCHNEAYFASNPKHQISVANFVLEALGYTEFNSIGMCSNFDEAIAMAHGEITIGAYESGIFFSDSRLLDFMLNGDVDSITFKLAPIMKAYSNSRALFWEINESIDSYCFAYYEQGELRRAFAVEMDDEPIVDCGIPLPGEEDCSYNIDDDGNCVRSFANIGTLIYHLTKKFLGVPLYSFSGHLEIEIFEI